jgi:hypothetical protein
MNRKWTAAAAALYLYARTGAFDLYPTPFRSPSIGPKGEL